MENQVFHKRSPHIGVKYYFVRDMFERQKLRIEHVATNEQLADLFTKPQSKQKLKTFCKNIGLLTKCKLDNEIWKEVPSQKKELLQARREKKQELRSLERKIENAMLKD